tara:strand:- start:429 stop:665 length:237 start_codon:yes stop_codon:yes gene_type:complete
MKTSETIELNGIELDIIGYYSHEEPMIMYLPDGSGDPGCPSDFDIDSIINEDGEDVTDDYDDNRDEIIDTVICQIEEN